MDIANILTVKFPGALWALNGNNYSGLEWLDSSPKPSEAELEALWPQVQYEVALEEMERLRKAAYQAEADPLFFKSQRGRATQKEWLDKVAEIEARYPDPEPPKKSKK